ncbi:hypothetical protein ACIA8O_05300 [Kitasatospora sp. NPDC051853]|uniref:hypothetical protein n=1 Tax=Kitasatospora sp. NPDC051853 TaxID=3364058 RepID=UPI0037BC972A
MSTIPSIARAARLRTEAAAVPVPGPPGTKTVTLRAAGPQQGAATPEAKGRTADISSLLNTVPVEVVALYTTVLGVLTSVLAADARDSYLPLRWCLYGGCVLATVLAVPLAYSLDKAPDASRQAVVADPQKPPGVDGPAAAPPAEPAPSAPPVPGRDRRGPAAETFMAAFSFAVWGLVIPESPLYLLLEAPTLPVAVALLSAAGAFVANNVFGPWLDRPARRVRISWS